MLAEPHLAKEAFALHLFLQRPEGLVDIAVTDENLHVVFLSNRTVDRPNSQGARTTGGTDMRKRCRYPITTLSILIQKSTSVSLYSIRPFTGTENYAGKIGF